jgi:hypothetical protein
MQDKTNMHALSGIRTDDQYLRGIEDDELGLITRCIRSTCHGSLNYTHLCGTKLRNNLDSCAVEGIHLT